MLTRNNSEGLSSFDLHTYLQPLLVSHFDGLMQERRNSIANALQLRLSCTIPSTLCQIWTWVNDIPSFQRM